LNLNARTGIVLSLNLLSASATVSAAPSVYHHFYHILTKSALLVVREMIIAPLNLKIKLLMHDFDKRDNLIFMVLENNK